MTGVAHVRHALIGSCIALVMRSQISLGMGCVSRCGVGAQSSSVVSGLGGSLVSLFAFFRLCLSFVSCGFGCLAVDVGMGTCSGAIPHAAFTWLVRVEHRWRWSLSAAGCVCGWGFRLGGVFGFFFSLFLRLGPCVMASIMKPRDTAAEHRSQLWVGCQAADVGCGALGPVRACRLLVCAARLGSNTLLRSTRRPTVSLMAISVAFDWEVVVLAYLAMSSFSTAASISGAADARFSCGTLVLLSGSERTTGRDRAVSAPPGGIHFIGHSIPLVGGGRADASNA